MALAPITIDPNAEASTLTVRGNLAAMMVPAAMQKFPSDSKEFVARYSVKLADALIEALNAPPEDQ